MVFEVTRQRQYFKNMPENEKFYISDDLLFDCIGLGCGNSRRPDRVQGFNSGKEFGYALLTYFTGLALEFRRLPFCEDRIYTHYFSATESQRVILEQLSPAKIDGIVNELRSLYEHTQRTLREKGLDRVNVRREIKRISSRNTYYENESVSGYAETLVMLKRSCEALGVPEIEIEMDTLNSFGDEGAYVGEVKIEHSVPASDVLYFSELIANREGQQKTMESGEWVIINRSPTGVVKLSVSSIVFRPEMWHFDQPICELRARKFMEDYKPVVFRSLFEPIPCYGTHGIRPSLKQKIAILALEILGNR